MKEQNLQKALRNNLVEKGNVSAMSKQVFLFVYCGIVPL